MVEENVQLREENGTLRVQIATADQSPDTTLVDIELDDEEKRR